MSLWKVRGEGTPTGAEEAGFNSMGEVGVRGERGAL